MLAVGGLPGCAHFSEEQTFYLTRDWEKLTRLDIFPPNAPSFQQVLNTPTWREQQAEQRICLHHNGENRITQEDGVSDALVYRRCALAPYPETMGARMENRPESARPRSIAY